MKTLRDRLATSFLALLFLVEGGPRAAAAQLLGPEFQINTYTTGHQVGPAVDVVGSGGFVVAWGSIPQGYSMFEVFGRRFDAAGLPLGGEFQVNTYTPGSQGYFSAAVAAGASDDFVVAWDGFFEDGSLRGVFGQRFDPAGLPAGGEFQVNSETLESQADPALASDGAGNFVVVWTSQLQDGSGDGVFGQRFEVSGLPLGSEFRVNSYTAGNQWDPAVAIDGSGAFVVVWSSAGQDGSGHGVFGQRFDSAGLPVGGEFQVNSYSTDHQNWPAVAATPWGDFLVVWSSWGQDGSSLGVFGQRFDQAGNPAGSEFRVNSYTTDGQYDPAVAADGSGNFVVAWTSYGQDGSSGGVFAQLFDGAGGRIGGEFRVNAATASYQLLPAVATEGAGHFVVVWNGADASGLGVFGRRLTVAFFSDGFEAGDACAWSLAIGGGGCPGQQSGLPRWAEASPAHSL